VFNKSYQSSNRNKMQSPQKTSAHEQKSVLLHSISCNAKNVYKCTYCQKI